MKLHRNRRIRALVAPLVLLAGVGLTAPACAQAPETSRLPLWTVTHDGNTVFLLGSIHLLPADAYPLDPGLYEAFDDAERVAFELDFAEMANAGPMLMERGMYLDGRSLRDAVPPALFQEAEAIFAKAGMPLQVVERMKPWMAAMTLSLTAIEQSGYEAESGIDMHFFERAQQAGKEVIGFETAEEQVEVFDGLDPEDQVAFMRATLDELELTLEQMDRMTELWRTGDAAGLAELLTASLENQPELMERILHARNRKWIPQIEALLEASEPAIVIVGMGHMVGDGSVIELLRERGYTVTR